MTIEINRIELIMSVHATESMKKNDQVLTNILSEELLKKNKIITEEFEGGYGNPIIIKKVELAKKKDIEEFIAFFSQRLTEESKKKLFSEFEERFDENKNRFYIRIEKEEAYKGILKTENSPRNVKIELRLKTFDANPDYKKFLTNKGILKEN
ncbi:MAG: hypothetical protein K9W46_07940 [Candidatus Heimdallarchaeum endolithica]|uniref:Exosome protein n=1 Tax=Candidatus Heimdallarchaeum endolithica TaxID=2876572 RepID=A0A9Y1BNL9_9ARCH|nr:MAG: hypothetical protein K9W46_07940 [Candidatus Heimdallarchaeum endolithica]